ncbi:hypothetical protein VSS74_00305 [Conexibacter stalactiti]|uniref:Uncharacterized protein n=1 Tax=Conexibacter stalactiti TaxID=1940611 RepID=A0ABU4HHH0_9ACTN|nr:hypothetical protein [Conexibacter stalactiti]MDW5592756.1 hypothetical protein [Conexibacter stalactiti]MEC5033397.1 hypothetical protein [Conexibacter stalactiti]
MADRLARSAVGAGPRRRCAADARAAAVHLRWLDRIAQRLRLYERRAIDGYLRTRAPIGPEPLPFDGGVVSGAGDALLDVRGWRDPGAVDQERLPIDLRGAALRTQAGSLTFELRFRERCRPRPTSEFTVRQGRIVPGTLRDRV